MVVGSSPTATANFAAPRGSPLPITDLARTVERLRDAALARRLVFFAGAGVSTLAPTSPPADTIKAALVRSLVRCAAVLPEYEWARRLDHSRVQALPFELVLDALYSVVRTKALRVFDICARRDPNVAHHTIIAMLGGASPHLITTNQDLGFEAAAATAGRRIRTMVTSRDLQHRRSRDAAILKLHGSIDHPRSIVATLAQAARGLSLPKQEALREFAKGQFVCFAGWSGRDLDIAPFLPAVVSDGLWILRPAPGSTDDRALALCAQLGIDSVRCDLGEVFDALPRALELAIPGHRGTAAPPDLDSFVNDWASGVSADDAAAALSIIGSYAGDSQWLVEAASTVLARAKHRPRRRLAAQYRLAVAYQRAGDYARARWHASRSLAAARTIENLAQQALALGMLAAINRRGGRLDRAAAQLRKASELALRAHDEAGWAHFRDRLGTIYADRNDYDRALIYYGEAADAAKRVGVEHRFIGTRTNIGIAQVELGDVAEGMESLRQAAELARSLGDTLKNAVAIFNLGVYSHVRLRESAVALDYLRQAIEVFSRFGEKYWLCLTQAEIGRILVQQRAYREAIVHLEPAMAYLRTIPQHRMYEDVATLLREAEQGTR